MSIISNGAKLQSFLLLRPSRFKYLVRCVVEKLPQWYGTASCDVEVVLNDEFTPESSQLKLKFIHSTDVEIGNLNGTVRCVVVVRDISDRGLEGVTFRIIEEEAKCFSLNCQDFEFEVLE
jgi:hypothetical protein